MRLKKVIKKDIYGVLITLEEKGKAIGRAYIYVLKNGLHKKPFGYLEDVFVEEAHRGEGFGTKLTKLAIVEAKKQGCYKLIATSRFGKPKLHKFYGKWGFKKNGYEFRIDM
jgi:GNAT superfamily N-acetyltransferase